MKPKNKKFVKIISLIAILIGTVIIISSYNSSKIFPISKSPNISVESVKPQIIDAEEKKVDAMIDELIKAQLERSSASKEYVADHLVETTSNHWKNLGIKNAEISSAEEKKLYLMTVESIKAQLKYYSTEKDESLEKIKNLYLPEAFMQYKEYVKQEEVYLNDTEKVNQSYNMLRTIEFSKPRAYKDLPDRIGIIADVKFIDYYTDNLYPFFIFKNINGEWKVEKQKERDIRSDLLEDMIIQEIRDGK